MGSVVRIGILGSGPRGSQMGRIVQLVPESCQPTAMNDADGQVLQACARKNGSVFCLRTPNGAKSLSAAPAYATAATKIEFSEIIFGKE